MKTERFDEIDLNFFLPEHLPDPHKKRFEQAAIVLQMPVNSPDNCPAA